MGCEESTTYLSHDEKIRIHEVVFSKQHNSMIGRGLECCLMLQAHSGDISASELGELHCDCATRTRDGQDR